jgi:hypothetical protein
MTRVAESRGSARQIGGERNERNYTQNIKSVVIFKRLIILLRQYDGLTYKLQALQSRTMIQTTALR